MLGEAFARDLNGGHRKSSTSDKRLLDPCCRSSPTNCACGHTAIDVITLVKSLSSTGDKLTNSCP
eukprot:365466-Chlamydomonas_euryale.AAC.3